MDAIIILARLCAVALLLVSTPALASDALDFRVTLDVDNDSAPTHVCVVATEASAGTNKAEIGALLDSYSICSKEKSCGTTASVDVTVSEDLLFDDKNASKHKGFKFPPTGALNEHTCKFGCEPTFTLAPVPKAQKSVMICRENDAVPGATKSRLLVLYLKTQQGNVGPHVRSLTLSGRQLGITVDRTENVDHILRVLGGFYAPIGETRLDSREVRKLAIEPRCQWTTFGVPRGTNALDLTLDLDGKKTDSSDSACIDSKQDTALRLLIPYAPHGKKTLTVSPKIPIWRLKTTWNEPRPPVEARGRVRLSVRRLAFAWTQDSCAYTGVSGGCPSATIRASNVNCVRPKVQSGVCNYSCTPSVPDGFIDFPVTVTLADGDLQSWDVEITSLGEKVSGHLAPEDRVFVLDTAQWQEGPCAFLDGERKKACEKREKRGQATPQDPAQRAICPLDGGYDDVYSVELKFGDKRQVVELHDLFQCGASPPPRTPPPKPVVAIPRGNCTEAVQYRFQGVRSYEQGARKIAGGHLSIPHPMKKARFLYFSLAATPASMLVVATPKSLRSGVSWSPMAEASLVFMPRAERVRGWRFNVDVTTIGSRRPILGISRDANESEISPSGQMMYYVRTYFGLSFLSPWLGQRKESRLSAYPWALGAGAQIGIGTSLRLRDVDTFQGPDLLAAIRFDIRVRAAKHVEIFASPRILLAERRLQFSTDFRGQPEVGRFADAVAFLFPAGIALFW